MTTTNMAKSKTINSEQDRISNLPGGVMECIMDFLPVQDAARTCVLSSEWRYVWANHPSLVLDMGFWDDVHTKEDTSPDEERTHYADIVSSILLHHVGYIRKFVIYVSFERSLTFKTLNLDLWLSSLCGRNLKVLDLQNSDYGNRYTVPSCVFFTSKLTHLSLCDCDIIKTVGCFTNIQSLYLEGVEFDSVSITTPLLTSLTMRRCFDIFQFDISAPRLASLTLEDNFYGLSLKPFFTCTDIHYMILSSDQYDMESDGKHLVELLALWPRISLLVLDGFCFKKLATGSIPDNDDILIPLNLRSIVLRYVNLDSEQIAWILYLLKNSPLMQTFEIKFDKTVMNFNMNQLRTVMVDFNMNQLRTVMIKDFTATRNEVMFVKILLKCAPLLEKLLVEEDEELDPNEGMKILKELLLLQRKYPNTEIIFAPNIPSFY